LLDVADVVTCSKALLEGRARNQRIHLTVQAPPAPAWLEADPDQLQQLLVNLLLYALDATPPGGVIEVTWGKAAGRSIELQVRDTGSGIPPEVAAHLFEPFVSSKETGLGLGLVVSRRIAEDHGGDLCGENRPGGGACFTVRLPQAAPPAREEATNYAGLARG
jgi:two-component system sensor histidine kinase HydH